MAPTPIKLKTIQPFQAVRDNWSSIKPYHDNYVTTISLATVITAFLGTVSLIVKHGFKMPRLHPIMEVEELQPSIVHPNEYVSENDLAAAKLFEFEMGQIAEEKERQRLYKAKQAAKEKEGQKERENVGGDSVTRVSDDDFHKNLVRAVANSVESLETERDR